MADAMQGLRDNLPGRSEVTDGNVTTTLTSDATVIAAPGAGKRLRIGTLVIINTSVTSTRVDVKDGTTIRFSVFAPTVDSVIVPLNPPMRLSDNAAFQIASATAVTDIRAYGLGWIES